MVHRTLAEPAPPGRWVDAYECVCGERYTDWRAGVRWSDALDFARSHHGDGFFRSRGPVLWAARTLKLTAWYDRHAWCRDDS